MTLLLVILARTAIIVDVILLLLVYLILLVVVIILLGGVPAIYIGIVNNIFHAPVVSSDVLALFHEREGVLFGSLTSKILPALPCTEPALLTSSGAILPLNSVAALRPNPALVGRQGL